MHPIIFELGPFKIYSYGLALAVAFIVSTYLIRLQASREGLPKEVILNLCLGLVISGILGARSLYILQNLDFYLAYPGQILMLYKGGLSFYGGFIAAVIFAVIFLKRQHLSVGKTLDLICPYLALAQAMGRIGCFFNGCCYGKPAESFLAFYFPGELIARHPAQLYASFNLLAIFVILRILQVGKRARTYFPGQIFVFYCLLYSISRFFMEFLRGDTLPVAANLTIHQLFSIAIIVISIVIWRKYAKFPS